LVRPTPFPWFGNQVLQVSCTHIYSASKVLLFRRYVRDPVSHRICYRQGRKKWCRGYLRIRSDPNISAGLLRLDTTEGAHGRPDPRSLNKLCCQGSGKGGGQETIWGQTLGLKKCRALKRQALIAEVSAGHDTVPKAPKEGAKARTRHRLGGSTRPLLNYLQSGRLRIRPKIQRPSQQPSGNSPSSKSRSMQTALSLVRHLSFCEPSSIS